MVYKRLSVRSLSLFTFFIVGLLYYTVAPPSLTVHAAPAAGVVDTLDDEDDGTCAPGDCSLREAIAAATPGETITFAVSGTIVLSAALGDLDISQDLTIDGGGLITVSGNNAVRVFNVTGGDVTFDGLTIADGFFTGIILTCGLLLDKGGGGILNDGANVTVTNSSFTGNAADCGGAILNDGTLTVSTSTLTSNSADDGIGGGIDNRSSATATISESTLSNNTATQNGGGINNFGSLTLTKSTLSGNSATTWGGGIYSQGAVTVTNSTFSDNLASEGGGLHTYCSGDAIVNHSTFTANRVTLDDGGGGIVSTGDGCTSATTMVANSIVSGNVKDGTSTADDLALQSGTTSTFSSGGHNLIGTLGSGITFAGTGDQTNVNDPKLDSLANNGGATFTHALQADSLAVDNGECSSGPTTDQRGIARPQDATCDVGAYEREKPPVADFSGTPTSGTKPLEVSFSDLSTGDVISRTWSFGDGSSSTEISPTHTYTTAGDFTVALTLSGPGGDDTETKTNYINVADPGQPPVADFSGTPTSGTKPLEVSFSDASTGDISSHVWSFGDGGSSTEINPSHTYTTAGDYTVALTVIGPGGDDTETKTSYISVADPVPPVADFSGTPTSGIAPLEVSFSDLSTGDIISRTWSFGDGSSSTELNPSRTYVNAGDYTVSLTVSGPGGDDTATKTSYISVSAGVQTVWTNTDSLDGARGLHSATLLKNGQILVAGGRNASSQLASAELYDPATGQWSSTGSLNVARSFHSATLLLNGMVLVAGGADGSGALLDSSELYDPSSGVWSIQPSGSPIGKLNVARAAHSATLLVNGQVLVAGGRAANLTTIASAELYDPATGQWSSTGSLASARDGHGAALLSSGEVMVAGGAQDDPERESLATVELYNPATGFWSSTDDLSIPRAQLSLTLLPNQKVLAAGGEIRISGTVIDASSITELYDPASGQWSEKQPMNRARSDHQALLLPNGEVLVISGLGLSGTTITGSERYNWQNDTWKIASDLNTSRRRFTATPLLTGQVLVAGGSEDVFASSPIDSAEIYDISLLETVTTTATVLVPMLNVRSGPSTAHSIRGQLAKDTVIELRGRNETGSWLYVCCQAGIPEGWILGGSQFVQVAPLVQSAALGQADPGLDFLDFTAYLESSGPRYVEAPRDVSVSVDRALISVGGFRLGYSDSEQLGFTPNSWRATTGLEIEFAYFNDEPTFYGCEVSGDQSCLYYPSGPFAELDFGFSTTDRSPRQFRDDDLIRAESVFTQTTEVVQFGVRFDFSSNRAYERVPKTTQRIHWDADGSGNTRTSEFCLDPSIDVCVDSSSTDRVGFIDYGEDDDDEDRCDRRSCIVDWVFCEFSRLSPRWGFDPPVRHRAATTDFSSDLLTYYDVRDVTLMQTGAGRRYIDLYYTHTGELTEMMLADAAITSEVLTVMEEAEPYLAALFNGDAGSMVISSQQVISLTHLVETVSNAAGPELSQLIEDELDRLPPPEDIVGKTVSDVRTMLENGGYDTPLIRSVGGNVSQLAGSGLVLQNNGGDDLPINSNGTFTFSSRLEDGAAYAVTVKSQPTNPGQTCTVNNGTGTLSGADQTSVAVVCASGSSTQDKTYLPILTR